MEKREGDFEFHIIPSGGYHIASGPVTPSSLEGKLIFRGLSRSNPLTIIGYAQDVERLLQLPEVRVRVVSSSSLPEQASPRQLALARLARVLSAIARLQENSDAYVEGALAVVEIQLEHAKDAQKRLGSAMDNHTSTLQSFATWAEDFQVGLGEATSLEG